MRKFLIDGAAIFFSILASFSVENYREDLEKKSILNDSVITLGEEISNNVEYTKEHLKQIKNIGYMTEYIIDNYYSLKIEELYNIHNNNPFLHGFDINGKIKYIKQYSDGEITSFFYAWLAWEPENIFFLSMLNSGALLKIKNTKLRREIESIYTRQEERVNGMALATKSIGEPSIEWFEEKENLYKSDVSNKDVFYKHRDQKLKNIMKNKLGLLNNRISDIENYLQSLQNVVKLIGSEYKKLD